MAPLVAAAGSVVVNRALLRLGLRRRIDGWRRAAGLVLAGEESTFILSAFGLDPLASEPEANPAVARPGDATESRVAERFAEFLTRSPVSHVEVTVLPGEHRAQTSSGPCYTLGFEAWVDGPRRFLPPTSWRGQPELGHGLRPGIEPLFNAVLRLSPTGECDIWCRFNHVGTDGVPAQELLTALETSWGARDIAYPTPEQFASFGVPRPSPGRPGVVESFRFLDFGPLMAWRKCQNAFMAEQMTLSAAISWKLGRHPAFAHHYIGSTVEVAPLPRLGRGVGIVSLRPTDYATDQTGLEKFVRAFNRQIDLNRKRRSEGCRTLDALALMPARRAEMVLRHALDRQPAAFGAIGVTVLKDAKVFGAPLASVGHGRGFLAFGSVSLQTDQGGRVGCVGIKGLAEHVECSARSIAEALSAE